MSLTREQKAAIKEAIEEGFDKAIKSKSFNDEHLTDSQWEKKLREEFPALKDAWDQYQTLLKLCLTERPKLEPDDDDEDAYDILPKRRRLFNKSAWRKTK